MELSRLQSFMGALRQNLTPQHKEMIDQAAQVLAQDNTELACAFISKTAVEKALPEMDKRLSVVSAMHLSELKPTVHAQYEAYRV